MSSGFVLRWTCLFIMGTLLACGGGGSDETPAQSLSIFAGMDARTRLRLQSYMASGQKLYDRHCANCHQRSGRGLRRLIPPLRGSDYLTQHAAVACLIRQGASHPMVVNGIRYQAYMPAHPQLRDIEIAEIMSYIGNVWGNRAGLIPVREVRRWLVACDTTARSAR